MCGERIETVNGVGYRFMRQARPDGVEAAPSEFEMPEAFALDG